MKSVFCLLLSCSLLFCSCKEDDDVLPQQQQRIVSFLTSSHSPRLVAAEDLEEESQLAFYTTLGHSVYRYIESWYNPDRANWPEVTATSKITITFRAYVFNYTGITDSTMPYFSNDPLLERAYYEAGLTPGAWTFEPLALDMASSDIIKGLRLALLGCRRGDSVEAYMTYNMAYGDDKFGIIPLQSPIAVFFTVDSVE